MATKKKPKEIRREDHPGHLDPAHASSLLAKTGHAREPDDRAFIQGARTRDPLAEELAEDAVSSMTSGQNGLPDDLDALVEEEKGGPFVTTTALEEMATGVDESNPEDALREPLPTT